MDADVPGNARCEDRTPAVPYAKVVDAVDRAELDLDGTGGGLVDLVLESRPRSVATARQAVGGMLGATRLVSLELAEEVLLLVSELVTNAVRHAGTAVRLWATTSDGRVLVAVSDDDPDHGPQQPDRGFLARSGRGIRLVDLLATTWGVEVFEGSKVVWFEAGHRADGGAPCPSPS